MKKWKIICFLFLAGISCKKDGVVSEDSIYGKWKLDEYCKPSGVDQCEEVKVPGSKTVVVEFSKSGKFEETYQNTIPVEYGFMGCGGGTFSYDGEAVYLQLMCMSSTFPRKVPVLKHTRKVLILKPFETGEYRFTRL